MSRLILTTLVSLVLAGCQSLVGEGPITFSPQTAAIYQHYLGQEYPAKFAVSEDGKASSYLYCPWNYVTHCNGAPDTRVIANCEKRSGGKPCLIFAKERKVVWKNPGNFLQAHAQGDVRLDGTEPVLFGAALSAFNTYKKTAAGDGSHKAFAVNYRISTNELISYGWRGWQASKAKAEEGALLNCESQTKGAEKGNCKLYMVDEEKVWFGQ